MIHLEVLRNFGVALANPHCAKPRQPGSSGIVEVEVAADPLPSLADAVVGAQIDLLILHGAPEAFNEDVVPPGAPAVHADGDGILAQHAGEIGAGELTALIEIEDLWAAVFCKRLLDGIHA